MTSDHRSKDVRSLFGLVVCSLLLVGHLASLFLPKAARADTDASVATGTADGTTISLSTGDKVGPFNTLVLEPIELESHPFSVTVLGSTIEGQTPYLKIVPPALQDVAVELVADHEITLAAVRPADCDEGWRPFLGLALTGTNADAVTNWRITVSGTARTSTGTTEFSETLLTSGNRAATPDLGPLTLLSICDEDSSGTTPTPVPSESATPDPSPSEMPTASRERAITLIAAADEAARKRTIVFSGAIAGDRACIDAEDVRILARPNHQSQYRFIGGTVTESDGTYSIAIVPPRMLEYIAVAPATESCDEASSTSIVV